MTDLHFDDVVQTLGAALSSRTMFNRMRESLPKSTRQLVREDLQCNRARTPKVHDRFRDLITAGKVKIRYRRFKPPQIVVLKKKRARRLTP